jgi:hypothetical protein
MLDVEREYFEGHQEELLRQFPGRFIIIRHQQVVGPFDSLQEALSAGARQFGLSPFLVRRTDDQPREIRIPALALGILRAESYRTVGGSSSDS